ncbi:MAG: hypothetical protein U0264_15635 [Candidatus Kapaibacterium sp.]
MGNDTDSTIDTGSQLPLPQIHPNVGDKSVLKWQKSIVWWLVGMPTVLIAIFIFVASNQIDTFNRAISIKPDTVLLNKILSPTENITSINPTSNVQNEQWYILAHLEQESMYRRYNQGGLLLMSRIFVKYLGFITGMILTILGAVFIIGKLSDSYSKIEGTASDKIKFNLLSSSPGVIFGVLGTLLMLSTIWQHNDIVVQDSPLYLNTSNILSISTSKHFIKDTSKSAFPVLDATAADSIYSSQEK